MIEAEAKRILNKGINEGKRETALRMIQDEELFQYFGALLNDE